MVSDEEKEMIQERMRYFGADNMGAYIRKQAIEGYIIQLDTTDIRELVRVLRVTSNSLNQLTKRVHETGNIYEEEIKDLRQSYNKMWGMAEEIMIRLADIN